jgi:hypothetical protein
MAESKKSYLERSCDDHCEGFGISKDVEDIASYSVVQFKRTLEIILKVEGG